MIRIELGVRDIAGTRFGISPMGEAVHSLRALSDPAQHTLHLPWLRSIAARLDDTDRDLLLALVGPPRIPSDFAGHPSQALPDFLTPRPRRFAETVARELSTIRATPTGTVRRDLAAVHAPDQVPDALRAVTRSDARATRSLLSRIADTLERYWAIALESVWPQIRLVLEADTTHRAGQLATGGARLLFSDMHPNLAWSDGTLSIREMVGEHTAKADGRGLLLIPSVFATKPAPALDPNEAPWLTYPSRGVGTLWAPPPSADPDALIDLLGHTRTLLLQMLDEPLPTVELARRLGVTPSAVSQHLRILHRTGLVSRARDRRQVLYWRTRLADQLTTRTPSAPHTG